MAGYVKREVSISLIVKGGNLAKMTDLTAIRLLPASHIQGNPIITATTIVIKNVSVPSGPTPSPLRFYIKAKLEWSAGPGKKEAS